MPYAFERHFQGFSLRFAPTFSLVVFSCVIYTYIHSFFLVYKKDEYISIRQTVPLALYITPPLSLSLSSRSSTQVSSVWLFFLVEYIIIRRSFVLVLYYLPPCDALLLFFFLGYYSHFL